MFVEKLCIKHTEENSRFNFVTKFLEIHSYVRLKVSHSIRKPQHLEIIF